jgi:predicted DsbA family dithiol-disulfide isomerase
MSDFLEAGTCNGDGCCAEAGPRPAVAPSVEPKTISVKIVSDAICPWCYVAKRQLERAAADLPAGVTLSVRWRPFELNPDMPPEGLDRKVYRSRKFRTWEYSQRLDGQVTAAAAQVGLTMRHDLIMRTPNTFNAHRLIWLAEKQGAQDAVVEGLFLAYFVEGRDIGDKEVLAEVAAAGGIDRATAAAFLAGSEGSDEVSGAEMAAQRRGLNGVPTFIINGRPAFSGAQRADVMLKHMQDTLGSP